MTEKPKTRGKTNWPLEEIYNRGKLGNNEKENRCHWQAACRLRDFLHKAGPHEQHGDAADYDLDLLDWRNSIDWNAFTKLGGEYRGIQVQTLHPATVEEDGSEQRGTDTTRFKTRFESHNLEGALERIHAKQVLALAAEMLFADFPVLVAAIEKGWNAGMIGETQGFSLSSATARACGLGMLRNALRNLCKFFDRLESLESDSERRTGYWRLVGTPSWPFDRIPNAWTRHRSANDNIGVDATASA